MDLLLNGLTFAWLSAKPIAGGLPSGVARARASGAGIEVAFANRSKAGPDLPFRQGVRSLRELRPRQQRRRPPAGPTARVLGGDLPEAGYLLGKLCQVTLRRKRLAKRVGSLLAFDEQVPTSRVLPRSSRQSSRPRVRIGKGSRPSGFARCAVASRHPSGRS